MALTAAFKTGVLSPVAFIVSVLVELQFVQVYVLMPVAVAVGCFVNISLGIFRNHLALIDELLVDFNATKFHTGTPLERLNCLNAAAEYVQMKKEMQTRFMGLSRRLKSAYGICFPSGELTEKETATAQFYLAIRSIIYKQTQGNAPDAEIMNRVVEDMVKEAITCTGIENIVDDHKSVDLFSDDFLAELDTVKMPITKFNALLKLLRKAISAYGRTNKVKAVEFDERLRKVVEAYNSRDSYSAPTSMGKSFIMRMFIKEEILNGSKHNYAIIVPTKALINEIRIKITKEDLGEILHQKNYHVVTAAGDAVLSNWKDKEQNYIFVMTPERMLYQLINEPDIQIDYLFVDEAHKISGADKRSPFYYQVINMLSERQHRPHIIFASPNVPNPEVFLDTTVIT